MLANGKNILIVEDEPLILYLLCRGLKRGGYQTTGAESAEDALLEIEKTSYGVCFLDIGLPGMSGLEALPLIQEKSPSTRVVIMTARVLDSSTKTGIERTAFRFMEKPFALEDAVQVAEEAFLRQ